MSKSTRRDFLKQAGTYGVATSVGIAGGVGLTRPSKALAQEAAHPFGYPE